MSKTCMEPLCSKTLPLESFSKRQNKCKQCVAQNYKTKYYKKRLQSLTEFRVNFKNNKVCTVCGESNTLLFDFAHFDRKNRNVQMRETTSINKLNQELHKGRILCVWCHRLETFLETQSEVKTYEDYSYKPGECVLNTQIHKCNGPLCKGSMRSIHHFYTNNFKRCKKCWCYSVSLKRIKARDHVNNMKLNIGKCNVCFVEVSTTNTCCFDFDHIDRSKKTKNIADFVSDGNSIESINREIKKCQLLCCKCHRLKSLSENPK